MSRDELAEREAARKVQEDYEKLLRDEKLKDRHDRFEQAFELLSQKNAGERAKAEAEAARPKGGAELYSEALRYAKRAETYQERSRWEISDQSAETNWRSHENLPKYDHHLRSDAAEDRSHRSDLARRASGAAVDAHNSLFRSVEAKYPMAIIRYHEEGREGYPSDDSTAIILNYARAINLRDGKSDIACDKMNNHHFSKIEVNKKSEHNSPLNKDEILEVIGALSSSHRSGSNCHRILNTKSHLIGDLVAASPDLSVAGLTEISEALRAVLEKRNERVKNARIDRHDKFYGLEEGASELEVAYYDQHKKEFIDSIQPDIDLKKSKSMKIIQECIGAAMEKEAAAKEKADKDGVTVSGAGGGGDIATATAGGGGLAAAIAEARGVVGAGVAAVAGGVVAEVDQEDKKSSWVGRMGEGSNRGGGDAGRS